ncbi:MAG: hypothetical protein Q7S06_03080 [Nanoarchaeota archaeon]|nr:hypothetical protein [Nanoarchaeota archaeon]
MKEEVFYNKKLSIFQKIAEAIEDAIGSYAMIYSLSSSENLEKLAEHIINSRKSINEKDINKKLIEILKRFEKDNKINKLEFHGTSLFLEEEIKLTGLLSQFILQNMSIFGIAVAISKGDKNKIGFLQELISSNKQRGDLLLKMMKKELKP